MSIQQDQVFDFQDVRKSLKLIGRAYQKALPLSWKWDQVFALKSLVGTIDNAVERAVKAGKDKNAEADSAFADAEEKLNRYARGYHPGYELVLGDTQNIICLATKEDNEIMKSRLGSLLHRQSSRVVISPGNPSQVRIRFQLLTSPTDRLNSQTLNAVELGTEVKITEVLWIFARLSEVKLRIASRDVPYFYLSRDLPDSPLAYTEAFKLEPLKDLRPENDLLVLVLLDRPRTGRIFFECTTFSKTYTNIWKPHNIVILKDLQGTIEAANLIGSMIPGEVRVWKRGATHSPLKLTEWTDVLEQAFQYPDVDWLIRTETTLSEAIAIEVTWEDCTPVPHVPFHGVTPLTAVPPESMSPTSQTTLTSSSDSAAASDVVHSQSKTKTKDIPSRQVVTPDFPLASVISTRNQPDVAYATEATGASEALLPPRELSRPSQVADLPGIDLEKPEASVPTNRRSFESTRSRFSTASPLVQIAYSPLERLALSIEDIVASTDGTLTPDTQTLTSWPKLERCLNQANIQIDPLAVLAAAARDSGCRTSS
ncbi:hypothetical protein EI94DRAFT_1754257 [Lactarius quietus]|nr:hypothetical protein EI94DRAFT_1754257 [Lactarius quietus]